MCDNFHECDNLDTDLVRICECQQILQDLEIMHDIHDDFARFPGFCVRECYIIFM